MIPYGDNIRSPHPAWATPFFIVFMTLIFAAEAGGFINSNKTLQAFGLYPTALWASPIANSYRLITSTFLHGDILHLAFNMFYLYAFGRTIERFLGSWIFIILFPLMSIPGDIVDVVLRHTSNLPSIGSSGSISTIMGLYLSLAYWAKIKTYFGIIFLRIISFRLPAWTVLIYFIVFQIILVFLSEEDGVAYDVHITCFVFGVIVGEVIKRVPNYIQDNIDETVIYTNRI